MKEINSTTFRQEVTESKLPVLIDFYADWCGPCRMLSPVIEQLADECDGTFKIVKANIDQSPDLASAFRIQSIPTLIYLENGKAKGMSVGLIGKDELERKLNEWRAS